MKNKTKVTKNPLRRELIIERQVSVPRTIAWDGWTRPEHVERWWGPRGWTATVHLMDVRVGGAWQYSIAPDDGNGETVYCMAIYSDIVKPSRLAYTDSFTDRNWNVVEGSDMYTTVTMEEVESGTLMKIITKFARVEQFDSAEAMGMVEGYLSAFQRFEEYLEQHPNNFHF